jgi:hypothetical protein
MASIFTPEFTIGDKLFLINFFNEISDNKFKGEFYSVPIPQDAPAEIPRIILKSKDNHWKLEISLERTNLVYLKPNLTQVQDKDALNFGIFASKVLGSYKSKTNVRIQRLAYISERASALEDSSPAQYIANKYIKNEYLKEPFNNTRQFELHSLKKYRFENFNVNSWARLKSVNLLDGKNTPVVHLINDINTFSFQEEPNANFSVEDLSKFYSTIPDHLESIVELYFKD